MSKNLIIVIIILVLGIVGYIFIAKAPQKPAGEVNPTTPPTTTPAIPTSIPTPSPSVMPTATPTAVSPSTSTTSSVKEFRVEGLEYGFNPKELSVTAGQKVEVTFVNTGKFPHNFIIDNVVSSKTISGGAQEIVEFTAPSKAGEYPIYCNIGSHRSLGMEGKLVVK